MTTEPNNNENYIINELADRLFDSESFDDESFGQINDLKKSFGTEQIQQIAGLQLVHSLLLQLADRDEAAKERRIQNLMHKIDNDNQILQKLFHITKPLVRYGIAALLIISFVILFMKMPANTAMASIEKMAVALDHAGDRTYSITVENSGKDNNSSTEQLREQSEEPGERAVLNGATLYLRGSDKFVLFRQTPSGRTVINGSDGQTRWLIRPDRPVLVSNDPQAFRIPMPPELEAILSLDFKATLQHIRNNYKIKILEEVTDDKAQHNSRTYLDASKTSKDFPGPKNIEIWSDTKTGLLLRIEFADIHLESDSSPKRLIIDLINQTKQPDEWFTRQAHQEADAEVDFVSE
jgi:outer membrane lipoprotein-sorting protein